MSVVHYPVLHEAVMEAFQPFPRNAAICDATLGGGGHTACFLELCDTCTVTGIDADSLMLEGARQRFCHETRVRYIHGWFDEVLPGEDRYHRILVDLGISMFHLRDGQRGFSLQDDGPLDMRIDSSGGREDARDLVMRCTEQELADLIFRYGEERYSRRIAAAIVRERHRGIATTADLRDIVWHAVPPAARYRRIHPATRTFQALRIAVNDELGRLERVIPRAVDALLPGGRLGIISFHSLEDRIVKHTFRALAGGPAGENRENRVTVLTKKPVTPIEREVRENPASRSAKLRVVQRNEEG